MGLRKSEGAVALFLKLEREKRKWGKSTLSKLSGVNRTTIVMMEQSLSCPKFDSAYLMLKAMGLTISDLEAWLTANGLELAA
jgi:DNA-binding XRE family transcriptional regulator